MDEQRQKKRGNRLSCEWVMAFIIKRARQKGNRMIAPHHPSFYFLPPTLLLGHPSACISSGQISAFPSHPLPPPPLLPRPTSVRQKGLGHSLHAGERRDEAGAAGKGMHTGWRLHMECKSNERRRTEGDGNEYAMFCCSQHQSSLSWYRKPSCFLLFDLINKLLESQLQVALGL